MNPAIVTFGIGGWYPRGVARLIESLRATGTDWPVYSWTGAYPPGAPGIEDKYKPYCAKPAAMRYADVEGHDIIVWIDAAFIAVKPLNPLIDFINFEGYYLCDNGNMVGEWSSDECLQRMGLSRDEAMQIREASSYCIGLNMHHQNARDFLTQWTDAANDPGIFPGFHTNSNCPNGDTRNPGPVSNDQRVKGHRHDQTAASIIAHRLAMTKLTARPLFTDYFRDPQDESTLLVNRGGTW